MRRLASFTFLASLVLVLGLTFIGFSLGNWQFQTWQHNRAAVAARQVDLPQVQLAEILQPDGLFPPQALARKVQFGGTWLPKTYYVRVADGFWVVNLVQVKQSVIPVVRGLAETPTSKQISGRQNIKARLQPSEVSLVDSDPTDEVLPSLAVSVLAQKTKLDIYGGYAILETPTAGLAPVRKPQVAEVSIFTGFRNLVYAIEWWFFAGFAVMLWWRWARDEFGKLES